MDSEEAKAVQEVAKTARTAVKAAEKLGGFLTRVFGPLADDLVGIAHDQVRAKRLERLLVLQSKTEALLTKRNLASDSIPAAHKIALPLIQAASLEDNRTLQEKWAHLLASAMDPKRASQVHVAYVSILRDLDPLDATLLDYIYDRTLQAKTGRFYIFGANKQEVFAACGALKQAGDRALGNLVRCGCLVADYEADDVYVSELDIGAPVDLSQSLLLSELGKGFVHSCRSD